MEKITFKLPEIKRGANCPRNEAIEQLTLLLSDPFKKTLGRCRKLTTQEILDIVITASKWKKNPPALANSLLRNKLLEIKSKKQ